MKYTITFIESRCSSHSTGVIQGCRPWETLRGHRSVLALLHAWLGLLRAFPFCLSMMSHALFSLMGGSSLYIYHLTCYQSWPLPQGMCHRYLSPICHLLFVFSHDDFLKELVRCVHHFFITSWFWIIARKPFSRPHQRESIIFSSATCIVPCFTFCSLMYWKFFFFFFFQHKEWESLPKCWTDCLFLGPSPIWNPCVLKWLCTISNRGTY